MRIRNQRSKRKTIINILIIVLVVIGISLIFNKQIENFWLRWVGQEKVATISRAEIKKGQKGLGHYNSGAVRALNLDAMLAAQKAKNKYAVGIISIPSVDIKLPIYKGMTNVTLAIGAGTMKANQEMGKANYALAGHHMSDPHTLFSPLSNIKDNDKIYLTDLNYIYIYQVQQHRIISEMQGEVINDHPKKTEITLITCASGNPGETQRIAVTGNYLTKQRLTNALFTHYFK